MDPNDSTDTANRDPLSEKALTERLNDVSIGDTLLFNGRDEPLEVVETERYSVTLVDSQNNEYTISQNLQTGNWNVHQRLWHVQKSSES
jgi:hypothetical protein